MKFSILPEVFTKFPLLQVGLIECCKVANDQSKPELIELRRETERTVNSKFAGQDVKQISEVLAWQEAHRSFGNNPNRNQPSLQALLKPVCSGKPLPSINPLVDCYNIISLRHLLPAGGEDLTSCVGDITLGFAEGGEEFIELGGTELDPPEKAEVVYKDQKGVLCRRFNWREAERTKLKAETSHAVLVIEAIPPATDRLSTALEELSLLVQKYAKAETKIFLLNSMCTNVSLS